MKFVTLTLVIATLILSVCGSNYRLVCYYTNWSGWRGNASYTAQDIDPFLCTHINYAFAQLTNGQLAAMYPTIELGSGGMFEQVTGLKKINPNLKIILSVGGWGVTTDFSNIVNSPTGLASFISNSITFLKTNNFDGLDVDWEFPTVKSEFTTFIQELKAAFEPENLLVTAATSIGIATIMTAYDVPKIGEALDFMNLMAYDLHGPWEITAGENAPMYARPNDTPDGTFNINYSVNYWLANGFPADKLVLGMGSYGHAYTLRNPSQNTPGSSISGPGTPGPYIGASGSLAYFEICLNLLNHGWTRVWYDVQKVPYAYGSTNQWVGYDDPESLAIKVDFIKSLSLGGAMFWTLDFDDFNGIFCNQGKHPLIRTVKDGLGINQNVTTTTTTTEASSTTTINQNTTVSTTNSSSSSTTTSSLPTTTTTVSSTTTTKPTTTTTRTTTQTTTRTTIATSTSSIATFECQSNGLFANKQDNCASYFVCEFYGTMYAKRTLMQCPVGLKFDGQNGYCNFPSLVTC